MPDPKIGKLGVRTDFRAPEVSNQDMEELADTLPEPDFSDLFEQKPLSFPQVPTHPPGGLTSEFEQVWQKIATAPRLDPGKANLKDLEEESRQRMRNISHLQGLLLQSTRATQPSEKVLAGQYADRLAQRSKDESSWLGNTMTKVRLRKDLSDDEKKSFLAAAGGNLSRLLNTSNAMTDLRGRLYAQAAQHLKR